MKKARKIFSITSSVLFGVVVCFLLCAMYFPDQTSKTIGYRPYVVLTDSMEPTIPTFSLVFSKVIDEKAEIAPDTIVTFKADRGGEEVLITHYYRKQQVGNDGKLYYRTQPEGIEDEYDPYETSRSDIVGTYTFHIPYIGKFLLFLKSDFAYIFYLEIAVIMLINYTIRTRWKEKEEAGVEEEKRGIKVSDIKFNKKEDFLNLHIYTIEATLQNTFFLSRKNINITVKCFNNNEVCFEKIDNILPNTYLHHKQKTTFSLDVHVEKEIDAVVIIVNHAHK